MPSQNPAREVVEASRTRLAAVALSMPLRVVTPVADHCGAGAPGATDALRPAVLAHEGEALGVVHQARKVDQVRCSHGGSSLRSRPPTPALAIAPGGLSPTSQS